MFNLKVVEWKKFFFAYVEKYPCGAMIIITVGKIATKNKQEA